jgi:RNA polymerase sigma-70 factor (ECF subfamily)
MSMTQAMTPASMQTAFDVDLTAILPRLRVYALSLTRNRDRADDLVQQTAMKALAGRASFRTDTNFSAWIFRIQRNEFISGLRRAKPIAEVSDKVMAEVAQPMQQEAGILLREFLAAFAKLSSSARKTLLVVGLDGQGYQQIATAAGISVGTVKSRVSRARAQLALLLDPMGEMLRSPRTRASACA